MTGQNPPGSALRERREATLYRLVFRIARAHTAEMVEEIRARGFPELKASYVPLLASLDTAGTRVSTLAARAAVTRQAASQLLDEIEARGYVERAPDPSDGRAVLVRRTEAGWELLGVALDVVDGLEAELVELVGNDTFARLKATLAQIADRVDPGGKIDSD